MSDPTADAHRLVNHTLNAWARRDLEETIRHLAPDIDFFVNVDPDIAPFAASARGRDAVRARLQVMLDTFHFDAFIAEEVRVSPGSPTVARVSIAYFYREKTTNQRLDGRFRVVFYIDDGAIVRLEELHDSRYIEAFAQLVKAMVVASKNTGES